ncbi:TonB-dependent receptor [Erythrobacter litoralis HTCC2594]|uniref:TonB-dependent receptor n=1 Tax=Erythrobacter litoralis (strain HTCC2594) TaxID=314225 RepID=Q2NDT4_ERYLH|nr:TonB-dependent receptor [Erythrobacter litoralis HTCC2594]
MKYSLRHSIAFGALASALAFMPSAASAQANPQQAGAGDSQVEDQGRTIVVTGSLIRGTPEDAALPVDVYTSEDLAKQGVDSPLEFIKELPSVGAVLGDTNQFSTSAQGFQGVGSINLRGLGPQRTLVLVNGKRTILTPGAGFVDTQLIPLFALERVEILKDGAGTTYGSDAIAGVANFITRSDFVGLELQGDYSLISGSDNDYSLSALAGFEFGDANIVIGAGWQHRSELPTTERDYTALPYTVNPSGFSALSTPGLFAATYLTGQPDNPATPGNEALNTVTRPDRGCNELGGFQDGAICRFTFIPFDNIVEDEDRYQVFGQFTVDLSDRVRFQADAMWARSDLESINYSPAFPPTQGPRGSGFLSAFTTSPNNPGVAPFLAQQGLPANNPGPLVAVTNVLFRPLAISATRSIPIAVRAPALPATRPIASAAASTSNSMTA